MVVLRKLSFGMKLCIASRQCCPQPVMERDQLFVILNLTDLV